MKPGRYLLEINGFAYVDGDEANFFALLVEICDDIPLTLRGKVVWVDQRLDIQEFGGRGPAGRRTT